MQQDKYLKLRTRCWELLEPGSEKDSFSKKVDIFLLLLISLNVFSVILETVDQLYNKYEKVFFYTLRSSQFLFSL